MVALWMGYVTLVTALLAAGAWAADRALMRLGRARRWAWAAAVAGAFAVPAAAAWRGAGRRTAAPAPASVVTEAAAGVGVASRPVPESLGPRALGVSVPVPAAARARFRDVAAARIARAAGAAAAALAPLDRLLLAAWLLASLAGAAVLARGVWALRVGRRAWRPVEVDGGPAWLTRDLGPAVVGAFRPHIVLPAWAVHGLGADELRLVLAHERAHVRARDPLLLALALYAVLLLAPWNVALWAVVRRLRLTVEADCDQRVLAACALAGAPLGAPRYAHVLVDLAERALAERNTAWPPVAPAGALTTSLLDPPGAVERRVTWVLGTARRPSWRRAALSVSSRVIFPTS